MIKFNGKVVDVNRFPDGTLLLKEEPRFPGDAKKWACIEWHFENNEELVTLIYLTKHLHENGIENISLLMPYIPNARQDRIKESHDVFTLKYFADIINYLNFSCVQVLDPHSAVSEALINKILVISPQVCIDNAIQNFEPSMLFFPDEGAMKRYAGMTTMPYAFGIKKRDWKTGQILGLDVAGDVDSIKGKDILIVDDICSRGGTFLHSAKKLKELGANKIYLYITHCENTILEGELLTSGLIEKVFTTNSIFTKEHERIEVFEL